MRPAFLLLGLTGCTFGPGYGFGSLDGVTLSGVFDPGAGRGLGTSSFLTDLGRTVTLDEARAEGPTVTLEALEGGAGVSFDPALPPPGFSLCHNGHCHADDGSLPTYAEVEAAISGGTATFVEVIAASGPDDLDLLDGGVLALDALAPGGPLPRVELRRATLSMRLVISGTAELATGFSPLTVRLPVDGISANLDLPVDRDTPVLRRVEVDWVLDGTWLDGVDLSALEVDGEVVIDDPSSAAGRRILDALEVSRPTTSVLSLEVE